MVKKKKRPSGHAALVNAGRHPVQVGIPIEDMPAIRAAAAIEGRTVSNFVVFHATQAAKGILKRSQ